MIRKTATGFVLKSADGSKVLGHHRSRASAMRQEIAIRLAKKRAAKADDAR